MTLTYNSNSVNSVKYNGVELDCLKINGDTIWVKTSPILVYNQTPVLLHLDGDTTNLGYATLQWVGQGFNLQSTGGKFNGYAQYKGWYDFRGLTFSSTDSYTIEMWMYTVEQEDNYCEFVWGKGSAPTHIVSVTINNKPDTKRLDIFNGETISTQIPIANLSNWNHIAITYNGANTFSFYFNGVLQHQLTADGATSDYNTVFNGNTSLINQGYSGWDEVVIHNYLRYTSNFIPPTSPYTIVQ